MTTAPEKFDGSSNSSPVTTPQTKRILFALAALAVIAACAVWIYKINFATAPYQPTVQVQTAVGEALAEETIKLIGDAGQIVVITLDEGQSSELDTHYEAFKDGLKKSSIKILRTDTISGGKSKYGPGSGMSGRRFVRAVTQYPNAHAVVSLVGLPDADEEELQQLKGKSIPKVVAFARDAKALPELFTNHWVNVAIVPRRQSSAPAKPKTSREWFDKQFEIVRAAP
jgi:hypothetical protein